MLLVRAVAVVYPPIIMGVSFVCVAGSQRESTENRANDGKNDERCFSFHFETLRKIKNAPTEVDASKMQTPIVAKQITNS